jgi:hypothetical protein
MLTTINQQEEDCHNDAGVCPQGECMHVHLDPSCNDSQTMTVVRKARAFPASKRLSKLGYKQRVHVVCVCGCIAEWLLEEMADAEGR